MARFQDYILPPDIIANRPAAASVAVGSFFIASDEGNKQYWNNGTTWEDGGPDAAAAGTVTTGVTLTSGRLIVGAGSSAIGVSDLTGAVTTSGGVATTLANNAVTTAKITDANVTLAKIANAAANSKVLGSGAAGSGAPYVELSLGTNLSMSGTTLNASGGSSGFILPGLCQYRLSGTTAVPVTTSEVTSTSTIYWTPYKGNHASLYDGADWQDYSGGELSLALSGLSSATNYDVFVDYNGGTEQLVLTAWTNDTTRATALTKQDGVYVQTGNLDWLYVGTIRTISTTATCDFAGGTTTQVGGRRYIWNYYNRVLRNLKVFDSTDSWNYSTNTWRQANAAAGNMVEVVVGVVEDVLVANVMAGGTGNGANVNASICVGLNSTSTPSLHKSFFQGSGAQVFMSAPFREFPVAGYNYLVWLEIGGGTATMTWLGDGNVAWINAGLSAEGWA